MECTFQNVCLEAFASWLACDNAAVRLQCLRMRGTMGEITLNPKP